MGASGVFDSEANKKKEWAERSKTRSEEIAVSEVWRELRLL